MKNEFETKIDNILNSLSINQKLKLIKLHRDSQNKVMCDEIIDELALLLSD